MRERGFTLVELLVTLAIAAILLGAALPSFRDMMTSNKIIAGVNDLVAAVHLAKNEATGRNASVNIDSLGGAGDWSAGYRVYVDTDNSGDYAANIDTDIRTIPGVSGDIVMFLTAPTPTISFGRTGVFSAGAAGAQVVVNICSDELEFSQERVLTVSVAGRVTVTRPGGELC